MVRFLLSFPTTSHSVEQKRVKMLLLHCVALVVLFINGAQSADDNCHAVADVVLVLDSSGSIGPKRYAKMLEFVTKLTENFVVGPKDVLFGEIVYSKKAEKLFDLSSYTTHADLSKAVMKTPYHNLSTYTNLAFDLVLSEDMFSSNAGGRDTATKIALVVTDGQSDRPAETAAAAKKLRDKGVNIMCIGIVNANMSELQIWAGNPNNVFEASNFDDALSGILNKVTTRTCEVPKEEEEKGAEADVLFVLDVSSGSEASLQKQLKFVAQISEKFIIGESDVRFGVVTIGDDAVKVFDLNTHSKHDALSQAIVTIKYKKGGLYLSKGYELILKEDLFGTVFGGRETATKLVITVTGGKFQDAAAATASANLLRIKGYHVLAIAWGSYVQDDLVAVARIESNVFTANTADDLESIKVPVVKRLTEEKDVKADILFVLDNSGANGLVLFKAVQKFISEFSQKYRIGNDDVRFGAILAGEEASKVFDLKTYNDNAELSKAILAINGNARALVFSPQKAFNLITTNDLFGKSAGGRDDAEKIVIFFNGCSHQNPDESSAAAKDLRDRDVHILTVAYSGSKDSQISAVSEVPENIFAAESLLELDAQKKWVIRRVREVTKREDYNSQSDILLLIESSKRIGETNYKKQLSFLSQLTERFVLGPNFAQFAGVVYGTEPKKIFDFNTYSRNKGLTEAILNAEYMNSDGTALVKALDFVLENDIFSKSQGNRPTAYKILLLVTYGITYDSEALKKLGVSAKKLREKGIHVIIVGVSGGTDTELIALTGNNKNIIAAPSVDDFDKIQNAVITRIKEAPKEKPVGETEVDIVFLSESSKFITEPNFKKQQKFYSDITNSFILGEKNALFGAVSYGDDVKKAFDLKTYVLHKPLSEAINSIAYQKGGVNPAKLNDLITTNDVFNAKNGGRPSAPKVFVVLIHGPLQNPAGFATVAKAIRQKGIIIITIGLPDAKDNELLNVAGDEKYIIKASSIDQLDIIKEKVINNIRDAPKPAVVCKAAAADVILVIDSSASIGVDNYKKLLDFISKLTEGVTVGPNDFLFGSLAFSYGVYKQFDLRSYSDRATLSKAVLSTKYYKGGTNTHSALNFISREDMFSSANGGRDFATKLAIVLTDGESADPVATSQAAKALRDKGIKIISVGIAKAKDQELLAIAGNQNNVFKAETFDALDSIKNSIAGRVCEVHSQEQDNKEVDKCDAFADFVLLLDSSDSIGKDNYIKQLNFAGELAKAFTLGPKDVQFSASIFSDVVKKLFNLNQYNSQDALSKAFLAAPYMQASTKTHLALNEIVDKDYFGVANGGRTDAKKVVILMTDGRSYSTLRTTKAAKRVRDLGVTIITIGIAEAVESELLAVAGDPSNFFKAATFDMLDKIKRKVSQRTCQVQTEVSKPSTGTDDSELLIEDLDTLPKPTAPPKPYTNLVDVVVAIDGSTNSGKVNFPKLLYFAASVIRYFKIGNKNAQFGLIVFGETPKKVFDLYKNDNPETVIESTLSAPFVGGAPNFHKGFKKIIEDNMFSEASGGRDVPKVVLLITSGPSQSPSLSDQLAKKLKNQGVTIISVGADKANPSELIKISDLPKNVIKVDTVDNLDTVKDKVSKVISEAPKLSSSESPDYLEEELPFLVDDTTASPQVQTTALPSEDYIQYLDVDTESKPSGTTDYIIYEEDPFPDDFGGVVKLCGSNAMTLELELPQTVAEPSGRAPAASKCTKNVKKDVVFVLDSSASVTSDNWSKQLQFAADLVKLFNLGDTGFQFGAASYGYTGDKLFDLNKFQDAAAIEKALKGARYQNAQSYAHKGLNLITKRNIFCTAAGARAPAQKVIVLFTDGVSTDSSKTILEATKLKLLGVRIITVAVGNEVSPQELAAISKPSDTFKAFSFNTLEFVKKDLVDVLCN
ncbi:collagen alpha-6(VI) chain-like [Physella acuta]|uniref:collagen alpha-6(VI) chain-like n=1 Tax=Physella acuta TaxID=109671 RepID=UPI0027DE2F85|nr:collagen alpha-6(VI) chain-like [Physella acuta]